MRYYPPNFNLESRSFPEAWENAVKFCMQEGMIIKPEEGAKQNTRDMCSKIVLYGNGIKDIFEQKLHPKFPTKKLHCEQYIKEYTREWVAAQKLLPESAQFVYNYMDRFIDRNGLDQIYKLQQNIESQGLSRRHQIITWEPETDMFSSSPPCLQRIWIRKLSDEDCEMHFDWRSRDLFAAWMTNYIGLLDMIKREILTPLNLNLIKLVDNCNSLHIYEGDWKTALLV